MALAQNLITKIFGSKHDRDIKKIIPTAHEINKLSKEYKNLSEDELKAKTDEFRDRLKSGEAIEKGADCEGETWSGHHAEQQTS